MDLTEQESAMHGGEEGPAVAKAMELLVTLGELYGATELVDITCAHGGLAGIEVNGVEGVELLETFAETAEARVPATYNPLTFDHRYAEALGADPEGMALQRRIEAAYDRLGYREGGTCTPYEAGNLPAYGEHIAWAESSALTYANSVIGARTNRESPISAIAAAVTGKTPYYGLQLAENRVPEVAFELTAAARDRLTTTDRYSALGYYVGTRAENRVPIVGGLPDLDPPALKLLGAAMATYGSVSLFHAAGLTPEAREHGHTVDAVEAPPTTIDEEGLEAAHRDLGPSAGRSVDTVVLGCPQYAADQLETVASQLAGASVAPGVDLFVCASGAVRERAERSGAVEAIEAAGGMVTETCTCPMAFDRIGTESMATDSTKAVFYAGGTSDAEPAFGSLEACIEAATTGAWPD